MDLDDKKQYVRIVERASIRPSLNNEEEKAEEEEDVEPTLFALRSEQSKGKVN